MSLATYNHSMILGIPNDNPISVLRIYLILICSDICYMILLTPPRKGIQWDRYQWEYPFIFTHGKICKGKDMHTVMRCIFSQRNLIYLIISIEFSDISSSYHSNISIENPVRRYSTFYLILFAYAFSFLIFSLYKQVNTFFINQSRM